MMKTGALFGGSQEGPMRRWVCQDLSDHDIPRTHIPSLWEGTFDSIEVGLSGLVETCNTRSFRQGLFVLF